MQHWLRYVALRSIWLQMPPSVWCAFSLCSSQLLLLYCRSAYPTNGFMIINRLHLNDLIEPINKNLEFQLQDPFLLYRNEKGWPFLLLLYLLYFSVLNYFALFHFKSTNCMKYAPLEILRNS